MFFFASEILLTALQPFAASNISAETCGHSESVLCWVSTSAFLKSLLNLNAGKKIGCDIGGAKELGVIHFLLFGELKSPRIFQITG